MSKEIQCKCCKEYWWDDNIHPTSGLCPNCYDYVTDVEAKLALTEKALELACEHIKEDLKCDDTENEIYNYFKTQAKEMLENE